MAAAACGSLDVFMVLSILLIISVALAQGENQFIDNGFNGEKLHLGGSMKTSRLKHTFMQT